MNAVVKHTSVSMEVESGSEDVSKESDLLFIDECCEGWNICKLEDVRVAVGDGSGINVLCGVGRR